VTYEIAPLSMTLNDLEVIDLWQAFPRGTRFVEPRQHSNWRRIARSICGSWASC